MGSAKPATEALETAAKLRRRKKPQSDPLAKILCNPQGHEWPGTGTRATTILMNQDALSSFPAIVWSTDDEDFEEEKDFWKRIGAWEADAAQQLSELPTLKEPPLAGYQMKRSQECTELCSLANQAITSTRRQVAANIA